MSSLEFFFKTDTFKGRLRIFIVNLILFVVFLISVFLMSMTKSQIERTYVKELRAIVRMQTQAVEKWFNERELDIRILSSMQLVRELDLKRVKEIFTDFADNQSEFYFVSLVQKDGFSIIDTTFEEKQYFGDEDFFKEAFEGSATISRAKDYKGVPIIHFASPIFDKYNEVSFIIIAAVRLSSIQSIVESFRFSKTGETFIVNSDNQLLTKRKLEKDTSLLNSGVVTNIKNGFYINYNKDEVLGVYSKTNFDRWYIVAQISKDEMYEMFEEFTIYVAVFIAILLIAIMPLIIVFSNKIVNPLQFLLFGSKKIENGDYGYEINSDLISNATCELRDLTHSFNSMSNVLKNVIDELTVQSTIDILSKLYNRRELLRLSELKFNKALKKQNSIAVLMIDIDFFKRINDNYGHQTGDIAIEMVANTIKTSITNLDIAGRYGGEEFMVFICDTNKDLVFNIAQRIRNNIEKLIIKNNDTSFSCTCSIGAFYVETIDNNLDLQLSIEQADQALYEAKETGRNKVVIYTK